MLLDLDKVGQVNYTMNKFLLNNTFRTNLKKGSRTCDESYNASGLKAEH